MGKYKPRKYQEEDLIKLNEAFAVERISDRETRMMFQAPTGYGKTIITNDMSDQYIQKGTFGLVLAHRRELIFQAAEKYVEEYEQTAGFILSGQKVNKKATMQAASIQTLNSWLKRGKDIEWLVENTSFVVIDEAHRSSRNAKMYQDTLEHFKHAKVLGVSATPTTLNNKGFTSIFDDMVQGASIKQLQTEGHLLQEKVYMVTLSGESLSEVSISGGDYNEKELSKMFFDGKITCDYAKAWKEYSPNCKTIFFGINVAHSQRTCQEFRDAGISAEHIDGNTPKEKRKDILRRHQNGDFFVLCNVGIVIEGYDDPTVECVMLGRPTKSLALAHQQRGRVLRPYPKEHSAKIGQTNIDRTHGIVIDCANVYLEHGTQTADIDWRSHFIGQPRKKKKVERLLLDEETCKVFTRDTLPENMNLSIIELSGNERFNLMQKAIKRGRKSGQMDGMIARHFKTFCLNESAKAGLKKYPTRDEFILLAALIGSTTRQAGRWYNTISNRTASPY